MWLSAMRTKPLHPPGSYVIVRRGNDDRLHERTHMERIAHFGKGGENGLFAIEALRIPSVAVDSDMFAEVDSHDENNNIKKEIRRRCNAHRRRNQNNFATKSYPNQ